jgi:transposase-like protein
MNTEQRAVRRRRTRAEIQQLVAEFVSSGMEHSEFCRMRGLCRSTFYRHVKKHRRKDNALVPSSQLLAVELAGMSRTGQSENGGLTVVLASGRKIEVVRGFDGHTLERLISMLERV